MVGLGACSGCTMTWLYLGRLQFQRALIPEKHGAASLCWEQLKEEGNSTAELVRSRWPYESDTSGTHRPVLSTGCMQCPVYRRMYKNLQSQEWT